MRRRFSIAAILAAILCLWLAAVHAARADDIQVSAAVSDGETEVGQPVDFTITVNGATDASVPENITVDGLAITYVGPNTQTQISFGTGFGSGSHIQRSVVHTYSVAPQKPGEYVIPAQRITVNGKAYTTQAVNLKVGGTAASGTDNGQLYFAEVILPRDTAYIGEALPVEIRLYVDSRVRAQLEEQPEITAEGCTVEKVPKPSQTQVVRNGRPYDMVVFKTAITPATAGKVTLGPVSVQAIAELPQIQRRRHTGSPFDQPMFQNPMFDDVFQMPSPPQQIVIRGEPVELTVKPLPAAGQPPSFAGAVGVFSLSTDVKPATVAAGDPLTITAKISGRGTFDRVTVPQITDPDGWKTYPASAKFDSDDDVGISGTKTFQMAVIAETPKTESPRLEWSYFDPIKEQYVTLTGQPAPIRIEGQQLPTAAPVVAQQAPPAASPATPAAAPDILYIRADSAGWGETFEPLYANKLFWAGQGIPLIALLAFTGLQVARKRAADEEARMRAQWRREKDAELATMQRRDVPEAELYQAAARALRLDAAIQTGRFPDTLDGNEVAAAKILDEETAGRVRRLFDRQAEVLYAGSSGGRGAASAQSRTDVMETVKGYQNAIPAA